MRRCARSCSPAVKPGRRTVPGNKGLTRVHTSQLSGARAKNGPSRLRRIGDKDAHTGIHYTFLNDHFKLAARTIADIYKARWQVELCCKESGQNLKVKSFLGTSRNAVLTQTGGTMCVYLLLSYIKFLNHIQPSLQVILRLLQLILFERQNLLKLLKGDPPEPRISPHQTALLFS